MTFLPIVDRELRVAARKRSTFWLRVVAAVVALVFGVAFMLLAAAAPFRVQLGATLFAILTFICLLTVLAAGLFFTADSLSEEKREGTLGFLFLTDLRGYDVVLGKVLATAMRGCFAVMAVFPVLALTFVMGGVAGGQFWKTVLALLNALFFSLATGLFVSSISRDSQRAMGGTLVLMLFFLAGGAAIDGLFALALGQSFRPLLTQVSPYYAFSMANNFSDFYWESLLYSHLGGWVMLSLACVLVPRTWQVKGRKSSGKSSQFSYWWRYGNAERRRRLRDRLMSLNPIYWLMSRERWQGSIVWMLTGVLFLGFAITFLIGAVLDLWGVWSFVGTALTWLFYLAITSQACNFSIDARRSGLVELLLSTPLSSREIVQGQWRGLCRMFGWALLAFLCWHVVAQALTEIGSFRTTNFRVDDTIAIIVIVIKAGAVAMNLVALCWFSMWMGMTSKNASLAILKTLLFVQILPWLVLSFASVLLTLLVVIPFVIASGGTGGGAAFGVVFSGVMAGLTIVKDLIFLRIAWGKMTGNFREMAVRAMTPAHASPPVLTKPVR